MTDAIDQFIAFLAIGIVSRRNGNTVSLQFLTADFFLQTDAIAVAAEYRAV